MLNYNWNVTNREIKVSSPNNRKEEEKKKKHTSDGTVHLERKEKEGFPSMIQKRVTRSGYMTPLLVWFRKESKVWIHDTIASMVQKRITRSGYMTPLLAWFRKESQGQDT